MGDHDALHVRPQRRGGWEVRRGDDGPPLSEHGSETEAERAATVAAVMCGATTIVVHDCYARVHEVSVVREGQAHRAAAADAPMPGSARFRRSPSRT